MPGSNRLAIEQLPATLVGGLSMLASLIGLRARRPRVLHM